MGNQIGPVDTQKERRGHAFYPLQSVKFPRTDQDTITKDGSPVALAHYFSGGYDAWIMCYDRETGEAFGIAMFAGMEDFAEWGSIYLPELEECPTYPIIERDCHWNPTRVADIPQIAHLSY